MDNLWITCKCLLTFSNPCYILQRDIATLDYYIVKLFTWHDKNTIILYYCSMFLCQARGIVYILEQMFDCLKGHIWCFHTFFTILSSIPTSTKPWKIKNFITFNTIKNHQYSTLKSPQTLINKAFYRTQPKIPYIIMK